MLEKLPCYIKDTNKKEIAPHKKHSILHYVILNKFRNFILRNFSPYYKKTY